MNKGLKLIYLLCLGLALSGQSVHGDDPDYFTEWFGNGYADLFDLDGLSITFTWNASTYKYSADAVMIDELPTDWNLHSTITLDDDSFLDVYLADGKSVKLYGNSYSTIFIGSNGYVTFGGGDTGLSESYEDHFDLPRISAFFDDLNPEVSGGYVGWAQLSDRIAVTFLDVRQFGTTESGNTFQTEMFYDGRIRISWLGMNAYDGLVGLSAGLGVPADFVESDMTDYGWDYDGDGIPNWWELEYFSGETNCAAGIDSDGDDQMNMDEYVAGTHPLDAGSFFQISSNSICESGGNPSLVLFWNSVEGRDYRVWRKDDLSSGSDTLIQSGITHPVNSYTADIEHADNSYYTLEVELSE